MPIEKSNSFPRSIFHPLLWSILAVLVIYIGSVVFSDFIQVSASLSKLGILGWAIVLSLSLLNYGLRFVRWEIYLRQFSHQVPAFLSFAYYIGGFAFTTTPGKAGEAVRSFYLKRHDVGYIHSLAAFFTERFVDLVAMVLLALFAALVFPDYQWPVLVVTGIILGFLPIIHLSAFQNYLDQLAKKISSQKIQKLASHLLDLLRSSSKLLRSGPLYLGVILALGAWGAEGVAFFLILEALSIETSLWLAIGIYSVSVLAGALSFIPGGIGSTEVVMVLLLKLVGADMPSAIAATLICRIATLWFAVIIGIIVFAFLESHKKLYLNDVKGA